MMKTVVVRAVELGAGVPKTIVPIVAKTKAAILEKAAEITTLPVDLVEWPQISMKTSSTHRLSSKHSKPYVQR